MNRLSQYPITNLKLLQVTLAKWWKSSTLFPISIVLFFQACASSGINFTGKNLDPEEESIAFGNIGGVQDCSLFILSDLSRDIINCNLGNDGSFYWHVRPGRYTIAGFQCKSSVSTLSVRIYAHFDITQPGSVFYCGSLVNTSQEKGYVWSVEDWYENACTRFEKKFPHIYLQRMKSLFKMEKSK